MRQGGLGSMFAGACWRGLGRPWGGLWFQRRRSRCRSPARGPWETTLLVSLAMGLSPRLMCLLLSAGWAGQRPSLPVHGSIWRCALTARWWPGARAASASSGRQHRRQRGASAGQGPDRGPRDRGQRRSWPGVAVGWHGDGLGDNANGQLGDGTFKNSAIPVPVSGLTRARTVSASGLFSLALLDDGTVRAWGRTSSASWATAAAACPATCVWR
jgi:Regulator of chromosome condensation (RCC1) repeat